MSDAMSHPIVATLFADIFHFEVEVCPKPNSVRLLYFRLTEWMTYVPRDYCFRLIWEKESGSSRELKGESFIANAMSVHEWLANGEPIEPVRSWLECGRIRSQDEASRQIRATEALHALRAAILRRSEDSGVEEKEVQAWVASGQLPKDMERRMRAELNCSPEIFDKIFLELRGASPWRKAAVA